MRFMDTVILACSRDLQYIYLLLSTMIIKLMALQSFIAMILRLLLLSTQLYDY